MSSFHCSAMSFSLCRFIFFCLFFCQDCDARSIHWQWSADCRCSHQTVPCHEVAGSGPERSRHPGSASWRKSLCPPGLQDALHQRHVARSGIKCEILQQRFVWSLCVSVCIFVTVREINWVQDQCYRCCWQQHTSGEDFLNHSPIIWLLSTSYVPSRASSRHKQRPAGMQTNSKTFSSTSQLQYWGPLPFTGEDLKEMSDWLEKRAELLNVFNNLCLFMISKVDRSVLEALPADLREQVEQSWTNRDGRPSNRRSPSPQPSAPLPQPPSLKSRPTSPPRPPAPGPALYTPPVGTLVLQIPHQPDSPGIVLELPNFSQVWMQPFEILLFDLDDY